MMMIVPPFMNYGSYMVEPNMMQPLPNHMNHPYFNHQVLENQNMNLNMMNQNNNIIQEQAKKLNNNLFKQTHRFQKINEINKPLSVEENNSNQEKNLTNKNNSDEMDKKEKPKYDQKFSPSNSPDNHNDNNKSDHFLNKMIKTKIQMKFKNNKINNMHLEIQNKIKEQVNQLKYSFPGIKTIDFIFENHNNLNDSLENDNDNENTSKNSFYQENFLHQNIFENSNLKLNEQNHINILQSLKDVIYQIQKNIDKDVKSSQEQIFIQLFSLQIPISNDQFYSLNFHFKIKFCCFIFSKFFDLKKIDSMYQQIYPFINFYEFLMKNPNKESLLDNFFYEDTIISSIFDLSTSTKPEKIRIYYFIKKILIYLNSHLDTFNEFLDYKLGNTTELSEQFSDLFIKQKKQKYKININENYKSMNLEKLILNISMPKIQIFIFFSKINMNDFPKPQTIKFKTDSQSDEHVITLNSFEKDKILCGKSRRKDEKIKYAFKGIRNRLYQNFCQKDKIKTPAKILKKKFNKKYLFDNEKAINYFYNNELSKSGLYCLKELTLLRKDMINYKNNNYIGDMVQISIFSKPNELLLQDCPSFSNFEKLLFHPQSKVSWFLQDILSTIPAFESFFIFPADKIIKRIKK